MTPPCHPEERSEPCHSEERSDEESLEGDASGDEHRSFASLRMTGVFAQDRLRETRARGRDS